ncbi:hypothetical protein [Haloplanus rubicundus]|uniref:hypothetical protein n=1 Tax=Haloplanus rubicundus TaxID=1547898 RepID=UPI00165102FC|nr:hypothetical protein [Haloplanus rubicundus]
MAAHSPDDIREKVTEIEVVSISEPEEASNERGNHEVDVAVTMMGVVTERYRFQFFRPPENADFPSYGSGPISMTEGASPSKYYNEARFKAAEELAEYTNTSVELSVEPASELKEIEEQYAE